MRYGDWKLTFIDQEEWFRAEQNSLSSPYITNLKLDPFERFHKARGYDEWAENRSWVFGPAGRQIARFVSTFRDYPPSQQSMSVQIGDFNKTY